MGSECFLEHKFVDYTEKRNFLVGMVIVQYYAEA